MNSVVRAAWSHPFEFADAQRTEAARMLRRQDHEMVDRYLQLVEKAVVFLNLEMDIAGDTPPERPAISLELLSRIAKHARDLEQALQELDLTGSEIALAMALTRLSRGSETIEYMLHDLPLLYICAEGADQFIDQPRRGRPPDEIERRFIGTIACYYKECFGRVPPYSRGASFPRFVRFVLNIARPGNPHSARDNSKIIKSSLRSRGLIR